MKTIYSLGIVMLVIVGILALQKVFTIINFLMYWICEGLALVALLIVVYFSIRRKT